MSADVEWIAEGLKKPGKTKGGLAQALNRSASVVTSILAGEREVKAREIPVIAGYLGVELPNGPADVMRLSEHLVPIRLQGLVEAGAWREAEDMNQDEPVWMNEPRDPDFPQARMMAFEVAGTSMNALKPRPILDGDRIIGVDFDDTGLAIRDGMVVVVQQARSAGQLREWSVKQVALFDDRVEFQPKSTDPKHKAIVVTRDLQADDGRTVEVLALVRRITNELPMTW